MSRRSSIQEKPKHLIYSIPGSYQYTVIKENIVDFLENYIKIHEMLYIKTNNSPQIHYWLLKFPNIQIMYSYDPIYTYNHHPNGDINGTFYRDRTNGLIFKRNDSSLNKSNLELRIYKRKNNNNDPLKAYFLEWVLPNDKKFNPDHFITDYKYYLLGIQWLFNNLGLEPIVPTKKYATNDRYFKFDLDKYTHDEKQYELLKDLYTPTP